MGFRVAMDFPHPQYYDYLRERGIEVEVVHPKDGSEEETIRAMQGFDGIAAMGEPYSGKVLEGLKEHLKILVRHGIGYDKVDLARASQLGICCCNTPGKMTSAVAETTLLLMLECTRNFYMRDREIKTGGWERGIVTNQLQGATVGLVGFGHIAQYVAKYLQPFACRILAYDVKYQEEAVQELGVEKASLEQIAGESDFVSVHVPHLPETTKFIDSQFFSKMKPGAFFINTSRGKVVDQEALIAALKNKTIAGAGLDVYWNEPLEAGSELRSMEQVFMTPHIATNTYRAIEEGFDGMAEAFHEYMEGKVPRYCLNPDYVKGTKG